MIFSWLGLNLHISHRSTRIAGTQTDVSIRVCR